MFCYLPVYILVYGTQILDIGETPPTIAAAAYYG